MIYTLLVVDMQDCFNAANSPRLIKKVSESIKKAIKDRAHIIFLEYLDSGTTHTVLKSLVKNYQKAHFVIKRGDDGSEEVRHTLRSNRIRTKNFKVTGVNTDCCVQRTVAGLVTLIPDSKI
jgi:nicotinamidase-related amidase